MWKMGPMYILKWEKLVVVQYTEYTIYALNENPHQTKYMLSYMWIYVLVSVYARKRICSGWIIRMHSGRAV